MVAREHKRKWSRSSRRVFIFLRGVSELVAMIQNLNCEIHIYSEVYQV